MQPPAKVVWLTGLSGSGKTTLAEAVAERLDERGVSVEVLDGDVFRAIMPTGFSRGEREAHARRVAFLASPLRTSRDYDDRRTGLAVSGITRLCPQPLREIRGGARLHSAPRLRTS